MSDQGPGPYPNLQSQVQNVQQLGQAAYNPASPRSDQFRAYAIDCFAEAMALLAKLLRKPDGPTGLLEIRLAQCASALREEPYKVKTKEERDLEAAGPKLLALAEKLLKEEAKGGFDPGVDGALAALRALVQGLRQ